MNNIGKIAGLALANAMIYQDILAERITDVRKIQEVLLTASNLRSEFIVEWKKILKIDYNPIFKVATDIIAAIPSSPSSREALRNLAKVATEISDSKTALRSDLMGKIFQGLLDNPKYTGTYYTNSSAAALLADLTFSFVEHADWKDVNSLGNLRITDLACGTGTLLRAAMEAISERYANACAHGGIMPLTMDLHRFLLENVLYGFDIFPFSINLTASALAMHYPEVSFNNMNIHALPYGVATKPRIGSLDFLLSDTVEGLENRHNVTIPKLDVCLINPPYNRSVGKSNLLFGELPSSERKATQKHLKELIRENKVKANLTAGLHSVFIAVADRRLKPGGILAVVLPKTLLSGPSWCKTRELLSDNYHIKYIISSHEIGNWIFTEGQKMAEVLLIAQKLDYSKETKDLETIFVNLRKRPASNLISRQIANRIRSLSPAAFLSTGITPIPLGADDYGEMTSVDTKFMRNELWTYPSTFVSTDMSRVMYNLASKHKLVIPGSTRSYPIPLTTVISIGKIGLDRRDVKDAAEPTSTRTPYPGLHGHNEDSMNRIEQSTNGYYSPLANARPNRKLRNFIKFVWPLRSRLMVTERLSTRTNSLVSVLLNKPAIAHVWWPFRLNNQNSDYEKVLSLWLNSTLGILCFLPYTSATSTQWISMKKENLESMPILDPSKLSQAQVRRLAKLYDRVRFQCFLPLSQISEDETRILIDDTIQKTLSLPNIEEVRELLAHEPIMSVGGTASEHEDSEVEEEETDDE